MEKDELQHGQVVQAPFLVQGVRVTEKSNLDRGSYSLHQFFHAGNGSANHREHRVAKLFAGK